MKIDEKNIIDPLGEAERYRSNFVRDLVQSPKESIRIPSRYLNATPKCIVQFWDDLENLPEDVKECMNSWKVLEKSGFELQLFDENSSREFIRNHLGLRYAKAFDMCYHPSMKSDYFRYSYIFVKGGFYVDADDVYHGAGIDNLFADGRLKLQPFCYDIESAQMLSPSLFLRSGADSQNWIFYFNTTPMIAGPNHPIIGHSLSNATIYLENQSDNILPEVQASTGPGNLTRSIFEMIIDEGCPKEALQVLHDWENFSTSKWPLSYRNDKRNWRLSNQQIYHVSNGDK